MKHLHIEYIFTLVKGFHVKKEANHDRFDFCNEAIQNANLDGGQYGKVVQEVIIIARWLKRCSS